MKSIQQLNEYIRMKMNQHDVIKDAQKYQNRLKWIMRYHRLLTDLEVKQMRENLHKVFK